jgi:hypothetical protein
MKYPSRACRNLTCTVSHWKVFPKIRSTIHLRGRSSQTVAGQSLMHVKNRRRGDEVGRGRVPIWLESRPGRAGLTPGSLSPAQGRATRGPSIPQSKQASRCTAVQRGYSLRTKPRLDGFSAVGKSSGTSCVTLPVAAHSAPRVKVMIKQFGCLVIAPRIGVSRQHASSWFIRTTDATGDGAGQPFGHRIPPATCAALADTRSLGPILRGAQTLQGLR